MSGAQTSDADGVLEVEGCGLRLVADEWPFARENRAAIDRHWQVRRSQNPSFFNGRIHLLREHRVTGGVLEGLLVATDFKSFLYWRETGYGPAGAVDAFGSALIRSAEGHVLLGRQRAGNINAGLAYLPGGFIDDRDVRPDGAIDIVASVTREVAEETGLGADVLRREPGLLVTRHGAQLSIAVPFRSHLSAREIEARAAVHIAGEEQPELMELVTVAHSADLERLALADYARVLLEHLFPRL